MVGINLTSTQLETLLEREWLAVNRIGGFACSTIPGLNTRKYHGLLVAAMAPPVRRMVLLSRVEETIICDGWHCSLACNEYPGAIHPHGDQCLRAFSYDPFPRWAYQGNGWTIEKSLRLLHGENTVVLTYTLLCGDRCSSLELRPMLALRGMHELMYQWNGKLTVEDRQAGEHRVPATARTPEVFFTHDGNFAAENFWYLNTIYRREQERGYAGLEDLWNPGVIRWNLRPGQSVHFVCSTDPINLRRCVERAESQFLEAMLPSPLARTQGQPMDGLLRAADQFVLHVKREADQQTDFVVAQYPWTPPSPRQSMIGLPGLFLIPGKHDAARRLLISLADEMRDGIIPSVRSEDGSGPLYRGADTSLWFINAIHHYLRYTGDEELIRPRLLDAVLQVIDSYRNGTRLGIGTHADGLLFTRQPGTATTWMDAQTDNWVVTPRAGMPVEINALWYNALRIAANLCERLGRIDRVEELNSLADTVAASFNRRFWNKQERCCFDVIDELDDSKRDASIRPNQLLAISLPYPVLDREYFEPVLDRVRADLLTPVGIRTLSPRDPRYQGHYAGNILNRDRAYHNGSAFPWLLGAFVTGYLRVHGRGEGARTEARQFLNACLTYLAGDGVGQICELFDGDKPHWPGGAIASAASVAELLRCYTEDVMDIAPPAKGEPKPSTSIVAGDKASA